MAGINRLAVETTANIQNPAWRGVEREARPAQRASGTPRQAGFCWRSRGFNRQANRWETNDGR